MYKDGKWARKFIDLQREDGSWGDFQSLSSRGDSVMTTESALRRLERLGFTLADAPIKKAVGYMEMCISGKNTVPDRREKVSDWNVFLNLMLATDIRRFTLENPTANAIAKQWAAVITAAFENGVYDHTAYQTAYRKILCPQYGRINRMETYYPVSLLVGELNETTERLFVKHLIQNPTGIYYIYDKPICTPPNDFGGKETSRYLAALELLAAYPTARNELHFAVDWINAHRLDDGSWDLGSTANDKIYLPLSDDWRKASTRIADCTHQITALLQNLEC